MICRHVPAHNDAEAAELAASATVAQLRRVLGRYAFAPAPVPDDDVEAQPEPDAQPEQPRRVAFGFDDDGTWRCSALLPPDEGAVVEAALAAARQDLVSAGEEPETRVSWADALDALAESYLAGGRRGGDRGGNQRMEVDARYSSSRRAEMNAS